MKDEKQLIEEIKDQVKKELKEEKKKEDEAEKYIPKAKSPGEKFVKGFDYAFEGLVFAINNEKKYEISCANIYSCFIYFFVLKCFKSRDDVFGFFNCLCNFL